MIRFCFRTQRNVRFPHPRYISSSSSSSKNSTKVDENVENSQIVPHPDPHRHLLTPLSPVPTSSLSRASVIALSATVVSALLASIAFVSFDYQNQQQSDEKAANPLYAGVEQALHKSSDSVKKVFHRCRQTGAAASVLWLSLRSVLSSANHGVRSGFEIRVAALLADIAAANSSRRSAIVSAGGGAVVDWLLESVAASKDGDGTQAESARALAYLIADPNVSAAVLARPHAMPNLLRFFFFCHPWRSKKESGDRIMWY
ncbi:hypothetical protein L6164_024679 [Bauhinia variegata]|uniref:Uncharacterized protein n=1 Tax=Bauhinia variegata TaxID=167791 RepID=A0ACB9LYK9_BAUVA|nr:hypothetical protein L6164_024679 [Bauhinia variegata]